MYFFFTAMACMCLVGPCWRDLDKNEPPCQVCESVGCILQVDTVRLAKKTVKYIANAVHSKKKNTIEWRFSYELLLKDLCSYLLQEVEMNMQVNEELRHRAETQFQGGISQCSSQNRKIGIVLSYPRKCSLVQNPKLSNLINFI